MENSKNSKCVSVEDPQDITVELSRKLLAMWRESKYRSKPPGKGRRRRRENAC